MNKLLHQLCRFSLLLICILCSSSMFATVVSVNIGDYATANGWSNGTQYPTVSLDSYVTATAAGGGNTGKYYTSGNQWRLYQGESATLTISTTSGTLSSVTVTYVSYNSGVLKSGSTTIESGVATAVSGNSVTFSVGNSGTATNGQARITEISVEYTSGGGGGAANASVVFANATKALTVGETFTNTFTTFTPAGLAVSYASSNGGVATVDATSGLVTAVAAGTATITCQWDAQSVGGDAYAAGSTSYNVTVTAPFSLEDGVFDFESGNPNNAYGSGQYPSTESSAYLPAATWTAGNVTFTNGDTGCRYWSATAGYTFRLLSGGTATIAVPSGYAITQIDFTGANLTSCSVDGTALTSGTAAQWSGNAQSVELTRSGTSTVQFKKIIVTYESQSGSSANATIDYTALAMAGQGSPNSCTVTLVPDGLVASIVSSDGNVLSSSPVGVGTFDAAGAGTATITASWDAQSVGGTNYVAGSKTFDVTVYAVEDGYYNFQAKVLDYGSGLTPSQDDITDDHTFTAGNITLAASGKYRFWTDGSLRMYNNDPQTTFTFSAPSGQVITQIAFTGNNLAGATPNVGALESGTWTGSAQSVVFTSAESSALQIKTATVTYGSGTAHAQANVVFTDAEKTLNVGDTYTNTFSTFTPAGLVVTYQSSDGGVATVNSGSGLVSAVAAGTATITCQWDEQDVGGETYDAGHATYNVTVQAPVTYPTVTLPYTASLLSDADGRNDFTREDETIWTWHNTYGAVGKTTANSADEGWLLSPIIDLTGATSPVMTFEEALRNLQDISTDAILYVREGTTGAWSVFSLAERDDNGNNWTYTSVGDNDLSAYNGKQIQFGFYLKKYNPSGTYYSTWEFRNFSITDATVPVVDAPVLTPSATSASQGEVVTITVSQTDFESDAGEVWYTIDGTDPTTSATKSVLDDSSFPTFNVTMGTADIVVRAVAIQWGGTTFSAEASVTIYYHSNEAKTLPYEVDLLTAATGQSDFTIGDASVWTWTSNYGAKGTSGSKVDKEAWLISPLISLANATTVNFTFEEVLRYFGTVDNEATVWIREGETGAWSKLTLAARDDNGSNWTYTSVGDNDLSAYIGKTIQIGFKYVSTTEAYGTWEIKNFSVTGSAPTYNDYTLAQANAACDASVTTTTVVDDHAQVAFKNAQVVYITANKKNVYVREGDKAIMLYDANGDNCKLTLGHMLNGTVQGNLTNYRGIPEFIPTNADMSGIQGDYEYVYARQATLADVLAKTYRADLIKVTANGANLTTEDSKYYIADDNAGTNKTQLFGMTSSVTQQDALAVFVSGTPANYPDIQIIGISDVYGGVGQIKPSDIGAKVTVGETGYATFYSGEFSVLPPLEDYENTVTLATYEISGGNLAQIDYTMRGFGDVGVAPTVGMVVNGPQGDYYLSLRKTDWAPVIESTGNLLMGTDTDTEINTDPAYYYFVLTYYDATDKAGTVGFFYPEGTGAAQNAGQATTFTNSAHKAYMKVYAADVPAHIMGYPFSGGTVTGITDINVEEGNNAKQSVYTLSGVRVENMKNLPKGIYVVNGKKVVVK